jgi:hypothetical protein
VVLILVMVLVFIIVLLWPRRSPQPDLPVAGNGPVPAASEAPAP